MRLGRLCGALEGLLQGKLSRYTSDELKCNALCFEMPTRGLARTKDLAQRLSPPPPPPLSRDLWLALRL